jgi:hypothetical protein
MDGAVADLGRVTDCIRHIFTSYPGIWTPKKEISGSLRKPERRSEFVRLVQELVGTIVAG